jgi:hypothetical protein
MDGSYAEEEAVEDGYLVHGARVYGWHPEGPDRQPCFQAIGWDNTSPWRLCYRLVGQRLQWVGEYRA